MKQAFALVKLLPQNINKKRFFTGVIANLFKKFGLACNPKQLKLIF